MYTETSKTVLCGLFGYSRQAWYENNSRQSHHQMQEVFLLSLTKQLRSEHKKMGAEKLLLLLSDTLEEHQIKCGRDNSMISLERMVYW